MRRAVVLACIASVGALVVGACGEPFTMAGPGGGGSSHSSRPKIGTPCSLGADCGPNAYCDTQDCVSGTCEMIPTSPASPDYNPVCGCNQVVYWNSDVAKAHGQPVSVDAVDSCIASCSATQPCETGTCAYQETACLSGASDTGKCVVTPADCGRTTKEARPCSDGAGGGFGACTNLCEVISEGRRWVPGDVLCAK